MLGYWAIYYRSWRIFGKHRASSNNNFTALSASAPPNPNRKKASSIERVSGVLRIGKHRIQFSTAVKVVFAKHLNARHTKTLSRAAAIKKQ
jgi:hypothetical protein